MTVVVPVRDRAAALGRCVESLLALDYDRYEILVVDNGSRDDTAAVAGRYPVRVLSEPRRNQYIARNTALAKARGEVIAFTDSDCVVDPQWLAYLVPWYDAPDVGGVGGLLLSQPGSTPVERFLGMGTFDFRGDRADRVEPRENVFLSGVVGSANVSYRKAVLDQVGGFDEGFDVCGDYDLCWRVRQAGFTIRFDPRAVAHHAHRATVSEMCGQFYQYGKGQAQLFKKHNNGVSYFSVKTYLQPPFRRRVSFSHPPFSIEFDVITLLIFLLALSCAIPALTVAAAAVLPLAFLGGSLKSAFVVAETKELRWVILYPLLHIFRMIAFSLGKYSGSLQHKTLYF